MQTALIQIMSSDGGGYEARLDPDWDGIRRPGEDAPRVTFDAGPAPPPGHTDWTSFLLATDGSASEFNDLGQALHDLVIAGRIKEELALIARPPRLLLRVLPEELSVLPWEFMRDSGMLTFTNDQQPVARAAVAYDAGRELLSMSWPLRVLLVVGSHDTQIQIKEEIDYVRDGFRKVCGLVDLEVAWLPDRAGVRQMCEEIQPHVFHYVGHGAVDDQHGGYLRLEQRDAPAIPWTAGFIRDDLARCLDIRLAVLNACQSGQPGEHRGTLAAAEGLAALRVPAVIAMQGPIRGAAAARFAQGLYGDLSKGVPLDRAVARARVEVTDVAGPNQRDYAVPSLTVAAPPERILELSDSDPRPALDRQPPLACILSFVDRTTKRRQLWERLRAGQQAGPRVFTVTGGARMGKGSLLRWCLGVALVHGYRVAHVDLSACPTVDSASFLTMLADALRTGYPELAQAAMPELQAELAAYRAGKSAASKDNVEFGKSPLGLYDKLYGALAEAEHPVVIGIDGLAGLEMGHWLSYAVPGFVKPVASGQLGNVRLIMTVTDSERATRFPPQPFVAGEVEDIPLQFFESKDFIDLAVQRMRALNYARAGLEDLVSDAYDRSVKSRANWNTGSFVYLDIRAEEENWALEGARP
jgi:hypothetical protein